MALQYFMQYPKCKIISMKMTKQYAMVAINWNNEEWNRVRDGIWNLTVEAEKRQFAASAGDTTVEA